MGRRSRMNPAATRVKERPRRVGADKILGLRDDIVPLIPGIAEAAFGDVFGRTGHWFSVHIDLIFAR